MTTKIRSYTDLIQFKTFEERFRYLALRSTVGLPTFGYDRWMNQDFYTSREWRSVRHEVIVRDNGCDLGMEDREIFKNLHIHHMNPMTVDDVKHGEDYILNPEYLITTSQRTHNAIHYGDERLLPRDPVVRKPGDTTLW